jgi:hypothetical protein
MAFDSERFYHAILDAAGQSNEMQERFAKALYEAPCHDRARAVLTALREINEDMIAAGLKVDSRLNQQKVVNIWRAMIDAAMSNPPPGLLKFFQLH